MKCAPVRAYDVIRTAFAICAARVFRRPPINSALECDNMKEKTCSDCFNCESTYPLDPPGSLYCDVVEDYVSANGSCEKFKENAIQPSTKPDCEKIADK